jgi:hypothetical protein
MKKIHFSRETNPAESHLENAVLCDRNKEGMGDYLVTTELDEVTCLKCASILDGKFWGASFSMATFTEMTCFCLNSLHENGD